MATYEDDIPGQGIGDSVLGFWTPRRLIFPILVIIATFLISCGGAPGLTDPDYYWHLATGAVIWRDQALPGADPFSWTHNGAPWMLRDWGFDWLLYVWRGLTGPLGVVVATACLWAFATYLAFGTADRMIRRPVLGLVLVALFGAGIAGAGAPGPHLFGLVFFALYLALFFEAKYGSRRWLLLVAPLIMVAWVNLHGGFVVGVTAMAALALLEWVNLGLRFRDRRQVNLCLWLSAVTGAVIAAAVLNPYGPEHLLRVIPAMDLDALRQSAGSETLLDSFWRGPWYVLGGAAFFVIAMRRGWPVDMAEILFPLGFFAAGMVSATLAPFATLAMIVFAAPGLWNQNTVSPVVGSGLGKLICWAVALVALAVPLSLTRSPYFEAVDRVVPADVAVHMARAELPMRMFNDRESGGYLIASRPTSQSVFVDGRPDLYDAEFLKAHEDTLHGRVSLGEHFDGWDIGHVVVRHEHALRQMLLMRGDFQLVFEGHSHSLLVRREGGN